jgi:carboxyl-terminal processing protease
MRPATAFLIILPLVVIASAFVLIASRGAGAADTYVDGVWWDEGLARFVRQRVATTYVDQVDDQRASRAFYKAMEAYLRELDEYCDFIPPDEHRARKEETKGEYAGLGIKIREHEDGLEIVGMLPDGPAALAGLRIGDTIAAADGRPVGSATGQRNLTRLLKGPQGSAVRLTVVAGPRPEKGAANGAVREVTALRAVVRPPSVLQRRLGKDGQFGVIRITEFNDATAAAFDAALDALRKGGVRGLILDLRWNGGGVLPAAVHVADRFLKSGLIVRMEGRGRGATDARSASPRDDDVPDTMPLAVVVNGASASASEVVAGALQDHRRALLVGERTYGKFLVQQITDVPNRDAAITITTSRYYTPSGRSYQRRATDHGLSARAENGEPAGLLPDVVVPLDDEQRKALRHSFDNQEGEPWNEAPLHKDVSAGYVDPQLQKAMEILEGELVLRKLRGSGK